MTDESAAEVDAPALRAYLRAELGEASSVDFEPLGEGTVAVT